MQVKNGFSTNTFVKALAARSAMWPEVRTNLGDREPGWITGHAFFADDAAIDEYLDYEGSFHQGTDRKTCAAAMIVDYCYIFALATVPLFVGFGIVPNFAPQHYAMQFHVTQLEHDGRTLNVRRAHVRFLSPAFWTDRQESAADTCQLLHYDDLCDFYRRSVEDHVRPLVEKLASRSGLSSNALWRLVADAIAASFLDAGRRFRCIEEAKATAMTILKHPGSPLCNRQLHFFDLTLRDEQQRELLSWTFRARGGCCRYYTVEDGKLCETCVLQKPEDRNAELLCAMRSRYASTSDEAIGRDAGSESAH